MNYTENLHLLKPETSELFDVQHANSNAELIDAAVAAKASLEQVATMLEEIIETGEITEVNIGAVTTIREFLNNTGFRIGVGTTAEIAAAEQTGTIPDHALVIPTDGTDVADFEQALEDIEDLQAATASSSGNVAMTSPWINGSITLNCRKIGKAVYLRGRAELPTGATETHLVGTVPEGFRPPNSGAYGMVFTVDGYMFSPCIVQATGVIQVNKLISTTAPATEQSFVGKTLAFDLTYLVAEG